MSCLSSPALTRLLVGTLAVLISGCSRSETSVENGIRDGILHLGAAVEPSTLDPHTNTGAPENVIIGTLFQPLLNIAPDGHGVVPAAAESWEVSPDGRVFTFHLHDNLRWSNGEPLTSRDFQRSFLRALSPKLGGQPAVFMHPIEGAEAFNSGSSTAPESVGILTPDDRTLVLRLREPMPHFLGLLIAAPWMPVHESSVIAHGGWESPRASWTRPGNMVSNGPYMLSKWVPNKVIVLDRNPYFHDAAATRSRQIHFHIIESIETEERAFRAGQIHATYTLAVSKIDTYRRERPEVLHITQRYGTGFIYFNVEAPPFTDARVRRAFALAIDRRPIVETILRGGQTPIHRMIPPGMGGYNVDPPPQGTADGARRLLAEAGYPGGAGFPHVEYLFNTSERNRDLAEMLQAMWRRELGVNVTLVNQEWKVFLETRQNGNYQIARSGWNPFTDEPAEIFQLCAGGNPYNDSRWANPEFDRLYQQAIATMDRAARHALYRRMEALIDAEAPAAPLYVDTTVRLVDSSVQNWVDNAFDDRRLNHVWLAGEE